MNEWEEFDKITKGKGIWLIDSKGNKIIDAVGSMWCNVWGHSNPQLINAITTQSKKIQHSSLFNLTNEPIEKLAKNLTRISPGMNKVFFSDNGSSAMEIAIKMALQYWSNIGETKKTQIATLENGYHGDTFGAMSVGYVPEFFGKFKKQLFSTIQFPVPNKYRVPNGITLVDYQNNCLDKIEKRFSKNNDIAAFIMESGAQMAGGVIIYPQEFQRKISKLCKKYNILFVLDEIATGFGRLGSMVQYEEQKSIPDIVAYGKMLTGGYLTMAATLANKKIYDSFSGEFYDWKHLFHGHTFTGNPIAASVANENILMYEKYNLIKKIQKTSKIFSKYYQEILDIDIVGDIRHKGMLMGIELVSNKEKKIPIRTKKSINKVFFEEGKKQGIYLRTLGNIVMLVPPLSIKENELDMLLSRTIKTIQAAKSKII
ncbi:MAG: adenosylmethionine--8-amino-7-oxononanoate transaminase [Candidatus Nitrosopumilus limneticus]|nr:adenosylmethionine--8-amino-7-oxononanoate transaminase [Candidatus Nitrosopumilus limneticus]MDC4213211.1 adenosylmethionine--8-amino-7-oxononanoate transaminase [Candidatus Nitrosopumilus limneticus]MDC4215823.1 adenosylmethionine--8-amino-7-oxononanoate transaminase [Candidatus Nitrosopumilus limneticus]MDC4217074.1 adenosylmethionine--8-amino-7-oxononanoate transaminase [Candidatus Nitrosopumilus limneticus]MDC4218605.1 adenosylmethionine--8-amino-7-oxononanoate transaminase [Candidatus 